MGHIVTDWGRSGPENVEVASALLFCADASTTGLLVPALENVAISCETCDKAGDFQRLAACRRYEVACVDFSLGQDAADAVAELRSSASNRTAIVLGITVNGEDSNRALGYGVHFVLQQPISRSSVGGIIRAAYGLIIRERRRYYRCPLEIDVTVHRRSESALRVRSTNISEGGLCLTAPVRLLPTEIVQLEFRLPSSTAEISASAEVQWRDDSGRVGLRFVRMQRDCRSDLQHWLTDQLDRTLKPAIARMQLETASRETFLSRLT